MNLGKGRAIFEQLESEKYTNEEKIEAIGLVANMETHNSITKNMLLTALKWLFNHCCNNMWVKITTRPMTEEEYEFYLDRVGGAPYEDCGIYNCKMPDDNEEVLITTSWGKVCEDIYHHDPAGSYFEDHDDPDDVIAWKKKPQPYSKSEDNKNETSEPI